MKRILAVILSLIVLCGCDLSDDSDVIWNSFETADIASNDIASYSETADSADTAESSDSPDIPESSDILDSDEQETVGDTCVDISWFDDCVFLGDSLIVGLQMYSNWTGAFGNAKFLCSVGLSYGNSQWEIDNPYNVHPTYNGETVLLEDAGIVTGASKAIISMGINDIAVWNPERGVENARELVRKLKEKSPDMIIYLQAISPMVSYAEKENLSNILIDEFNEGMRALAEEEGCILLNFHDAVVGSDGSLPDYLCSDPNGLGIHLTNEACEMWEDFIKKNV